MSTNIYAKILRDKIGRCHIVSVIDEIKIALTYQTISTRYKSAKLHLVDFFASNNISRVDMSFYSIAILKKLKIIQADIFECLWCYYVDINEKYVCSK